MIKQSINLNMIPNSAPVVVHVNQYDVGEGRIEAKLYNGDTAYTPASGATAVIQGTKPDGRGFDYNATLSGNTVTADVTEQMTAVEGNTRCQIVITEGENVTGTFVFNLMVQKSALPADTDMSKSEYSVVMQLLEQAEALNQFTPYIGANGNWWVYSVQEEGYVDTGVDASISVDIADITMLAPDASPYVTNTGTDSDPVFHLFIPRGKGISSIAKTGTQGLVDTYTITYSDNTTTTFTVTNGADGEDGDKGDKGDTGATPNITATATIDNTTGTPTVNVTKTGTTENPVLNFAFSHLKGAKGDKGDTGTTDAGALVKDTVGWTGKNLLPNNAASRVLSGVTYTVNSDGSVTANGTATADNSLTLCENITLLKGPYILSKTGSSDIKVQITDYPVTQQLYAAATEDVQFTLSADTSVCVRINQFNGTTYNNVTVYPMLRRADIADSTYEPYHASVKQTLRDAEVIEGKNLLPYPVGTRGFIGSDGSITDSADGYISDFIEVQGGSSVIVTYASKVGSPSFRIAEYNSNKVFIRRYSDNTYNPWTVPLDSATKYVRACFEDSSSNNIANPMLRLASETDPTYEPYYIPLKDSKVDRAEQRVLGAKNLLPNNASTQTINGVTFTVNSDGSVTANGTASANTELRIWENFSLKDGEKYILSGCIGGGSSTYRIVLNQYYSSASHFTVCTDGDEIFTFNNASVNSNNIAIVISSGQTVNNVLFKPMLRLASDTDDTYAPYAMTNKELTEKVDTVETGLLTSAIGTFAVNEIRKVGKVVTISFNLTLSENVTRWSTVVFSIPEKYKAPLYFQIWGSADGPTWNPLQVSSNGKDVQSVKDITSGVSVRGSATWITS